MDQNIIDFIDKTNLKELFEQKDQEIKALREKVQALMIELTWYKNAFEPFSGMFVKYKEVNVNLDSGSVSVIKTQDIGHE